MKEKKIPIKTIYYTDEKHDEFSSAIIIPKKIDGRWNYLRQGIGWGVKRWFFYRICGTPIAYLYCKLAFGWQVKNRAVLRSINKKHGFFIYGNHTQAVGDAFFPSLAVFPKSVYTIVHSNNVSMSVLGKINVYLGALPLPDTLQAAKNFKKAVNVRFQKGNAVMIYPEAHIWPYYTGVRNFPAASFRYPVENNAPCFALTNVYKKRKIRQKPRIVTYLDGPFYAEKSLPLKERMQQLREKIYAKMLERSKESDCEYVRYLRKGEE